jgi:hypothetical protein
MGNLGEELENEKKILQDIRELLENSRELQASMFIQTMRIYDMLSIIGDKLGADAKGLVELHQEGQVLCPPPAYLMEEENNASSDSEDS